MVGSVRLSDADVRGMESHTKLISPRRRYKKLPFAANYFPDISIMLFGHVVFWRKPCWARYLKSVLYGGDIR